MAAAASEPLDLIDLPIEQLLNLEVYSASKFAQKVSEAPAAVSVVTAAEIKAFGWRTLADILRSVRGLYLGYDRNYSYLGARGFLRPGDYNTRFLLLLDGYRNNDAVFDQASVGSEFLLDVDLIERVEFVPGPGSSIYGANAFFGVINVISKRGRALDGSQVSLETGSAGARKVRASTGWRGANGAEVLLSASAFAVDGRDLFFPAFDTPANHNGIAQGLDYDRGQNLFVKAGFGSFGLTLAHGERKKGIPTASFSQVFNDPRSHTLDTQSFAELAYRDQPAPRSDLAASLFWGRYDYEGDYIYGAPTVVNRDGSRARWWGGEVKLTSSRFARHKVVAGAEYLCGYRRDQYNFDVDPYALKLDDRRSDKRFGVYLQDEIRLNDVLLLNAGLRHDHESTTGSAILNPRLALIGKLSADTTLKVLSGTAFRAPNAYELYYRLPGAGGQKANPDLKSERIRTHELVLEHQLASNSRIVASLFRNTVSGLITQTLDPGDGLLVFQNMSRAVARGAEVEFERSWDDATRLRTSYSWQRVTDEASGALLVNSPQHLAKFNLSTGWPGGVWRSGLEAQYVGARATLQSRVGGYWLVNATLYSARLARGLEFSASLYNLLDRRYADPAAAEHVMDTIEQDGRSVRLKLTASF